MRYFILSLFALCIFATDYNGLMAQQTRTGYGATTTLARDASKSKTTPSQSTVLHINNSVYENEVIRTLGRDSYASILLAPRFALRMSAYTTIVLEKLNASSKCEISLEFGSILVAASGNTSIVIKTEDITIESMGAVFYVSYDVEQKATTLSVLSGSVVVNGTTVEEFETMDNASGKSIVPFGSVEKLIFGNIENLPGITNIEGIGNFSDNLEVLKMGSFGNDTLEDQADSSETIATDTTTTDDNVSYDYEENESVDYEYEVIVIDGE